MVRALGPWIAIAIVVGTVIGSGVFKKPSVVAKEVPDFGWVAIVWIAMGLLALLGALSIAEVAVLYPRSGGNYVFLREGYGRLAGFLWGWVEFWIIRTASIAALATVFIESFHDLLRQFHEVPREAEILSFWEQRILTVGVIGVLTWVNVRGVRWGGGLQFFITLVKVGSLLAILLLPFLLRTDWSVATSDSSTAREFELAGLGTACLGVLWAYHGWMNAAPIAEEIKNPNRNLPLAFIAGVGIVIFLYLGANLAYHLIIPQAEMAGLTNTSVVAEFGHRLLGPLGLTLAAGAVMCSVFGALNGNLLVGPRLLYAMGEDRLAPRVLSAVHSRYHTPAVAITLVGLWSSLLVIAGALIYVPGGKSLFDLLTDYAMFGAVTFETLAISTIFVFRIRYPDAERPYRCPGYPVVPLLYFALPAFIVWNMIQNQRTEVAIGTGFVCLGVVVYFLVARRDVPPHGG
ncbi:MAG: amino acid permease [Planctomycetes bacterium]|nr:amino acid permease [Planctomycetota bacterium]